MKFMRNLLLMAGFFTLLGLSAQAQSKIANVDAQSILENMPEYKRAEAKIDTVGQQLQAQLKTMTDEYEKKLTDYERLAKSGASPAILEIKESELQDLQNRIQKFQMSAQEDLQKQETALLEPIIKKLKDTIGQVAKEQGYAYVLDNKANGILYAQASDDITAAVKKKLGLTP